MDWKRQILYPLSSATLVLFASFFIACAGQQTVSEDGTVADEAAESAGADAEAAAEATAPVDDLTSESLDAEFNKSADMNFEAEGEGLAALERIDEKAEAQAPATDSTDALAEDLLAVDGEAPAATGSIATDSSTPPAEPTNSFEDSFGTASSDYPSSGTTEPSEPSYSSSTVSARPSSLPELASYAFESNGALLNRYYIVRPGDTADSIAQRLYGDVNRATELAKWNGGKSKLKRAGNVVYYASTQAPSDTQMRSFFEARQIQPESYTVQHGDWLSTIAKQAYGDTRSWKEIALVNGIQNPDKIRPGQALSLFPASLPDYSPTETMPTQAPVAKAPEQPVPQREEPAISAEQLAPPVIEELEAPPMDDVAISPKSNLNFKKLINQNFFSMAVGGLILLLLLTLVILRRRRGSSEEESSEEFSSTRKRG